MLAACSAINADFDQLIGVVPRQLQPDLSACSALLTITAVVTICAFTCLAPCAARVFAIGAIQPGITLGTGAATGVHRQFFGYQRIDAQRQVTPGLGWFFVGSWGTA